MIQTMGILGLSDAEKISASTGFSKDLVEWVLMGYRAALDVKKNPYPDANTVSWVFNWSKAASRPISVNVIDTILIAYTGIAAKKAEEQAKAKPLDLGGILKWSVVGIAGIFGVYVLSMLKPFFKKAG